MIMKNIAIIISMLSLAFIAKGQQADSTKKDLPADSVVYTIVSTMPSFGKSDKDLQDFINKESKLPITKKRTPETRAVFVNIIIEMDGTATYKSVARGYNPKLDAEAVRIILAMPKWNPGNQNGKPRRVAYIIPFWFE